MRWENMKRLARLFRYRRERDQWEDPRTSIGERRGVVRRGKYICWEAIGPVREVWETLGPEIKDYIQHTLTTGNYPGVSLEIYMIGEIEEKAAPKILICSKDLIARREVRKAIAGSGILNNYPNIGLGEISQLPDLLAQEDIEPSSLEISNPDQETMILSPPSDNAFGRRLFISRLSGGSLRPATAGPILHINDKVYQLTVGHAFLQRDNDDPAPTSASSLDDCDFDGQSDSEEDNSSTSTDTADKGKLEIKDPPLANGYSTTSRAVIPITQDTLSRDLGFSSSATISQPSAPPITSSSDKEIGSHSNQCQEGKPTMPKRLGRIGKLAMVSESSNPPLDYALVELEGIYRNGNNEIPFGPNSSQTWLRAIKPAKVGASSVNIVTMTGSSGFLSGRLCATPSYVRFPNQKVFQKLYSVRLNGILADGDCGSGVLNQLGHFYGHIVAGSVGTGQAYIVPAMDVFEELCNRFEGDVTLVRPLKQTDPKHISKDRTELEPLRIIEFGSKKYFSQRQQADPSIDREQSTGSAPNETNTIIHSQPHNSTEIHERSSIVDTNSVMWSRTPILQPKGLGTFGKRKGKEREKHGSEDPNTFVTGMRNWQGDPSATSVHKFEQQFFALPGPLQVQIISLLSIPSILSLRRVSKSWSNLITLNESPISRAFLEHNPVPLFAEGLYPLPIPSKVNLQYVCGLWHRLYVSSRLSSLMAEWITEEHFQCKSEDQKLKFSPLENRMCRRLVPLVFTIFHFFETYRHLRLQMPPEHDSDSAPETFGTRYLESKIMDAYDNETLLQVHQVFPHFLSYLVQTLRPPSYLGIIERSLRGYRREPPADDVYAAILLLGGLKQFLVFSEITPYDTRRAAVDHWYDSISCASIKAASLSSRWTTGLNWRQRRISIGASVSSTNSTMSTGSTVFSPATSVDASDCRGCSNSSSSSAYRSSLAAGPPMGPLSTAQTELLLSDLPMLQVIWLDTAERLLFQRGSIAGKQDIKKNGRLIDELVRDGITEADEMIYGQDSHTILGHTSLGWGGLIGRNDKMGDKTN